MSARVGLTLAALLGLAAPGCREDAPAAPAPSGATAAASREGAAHPRGPRRRPAGHVGVVTARESTELAARIGGQLAAVHVSLGDGVAPGALIATIEDRTLRDELGIARAAIASAEAALAEAEVDVAGAREALRIERSARASGNTSEQRVVEADFRHKKMVAARDRARAALGEQRARVKQLEQRLALSRIEAPFAGTVAARYLDPGAVVQPGTPLVRLISAGDLRVRFALPADDARHVAQGDAVEVYVESLDARIPAVVRQVAPELDPSSQMIFAEAELQVPDELAGRVQAGLVARVRLGTQP